MAMMKSMMAVEAKLTQTAGFFRTELFSGLAGAGGTTIGEVWGVTLVKLLLHKSVLQQQKTTESFSS